MELKQQFHFSSNIGVTARETDGGVLFISGLANLLSVLIVISLVVILPL